MSTAFSHTVRSLQADRNYLSLLVLGLAASLFLGWLAWFLLAPLPQYERGQIVQTSSDGVVIVRFAQAASARLQPGQAAQLYFTDAEQGSPLPGIVAEIVQPAQDAPTQAVIYADMDAPNAALLQNGLTGEALVTVEQLSPAALILRTTGQGIDTPPVSLNP